MLIYVWSYVPERVRVCMCVCVCVIACQTSLNVPELVCVRVWLGELDSRTEKNPSGRGAAEQRVKSWTRMQGCNQCCAEPETRKQENHPDEQ